MDSKIDKQIKRYLKRISDEEPKTCSYNSVYYEVNYDEDTKIRIRFSDHFNSSSNAFIDIIKMNSDTYIIGIGSMKFSASSDSVVGQIKSLMLIAPELMKYVNRIASANNNLSKKVSTLNNAVDKEIRKLRKQYSEAEDLINLYDELEGKYKNATKEISQLSQQLQDKEKAIKLLLNQIDKFQKKAKLAADMSNKIINLSEQIKTLKYE